MLLNKVTLIMRAVLPGCIFKEIQGKVNVTNDTYQILLRVIYLHADLDPGTASHLQGPALSNLTHVPRAVTRIQLSNSRSI